MEKLELHYYELVYRRDKKKGSNLEHLFRVEII